MTHCSLRNTINSVKLSRLSSTAGMTSHYIIICSAMLKIVLTSNHLAHNEPMFMNAVITA